MKHFNSIKKKPGFSGGLPDWKILCKQVTCHVCEKDGQAGNQNRDFGQQKSWQQCGPASYNQIIERKLQAS